MIRLKELEIGRERKGVPDIGCQVFSVRVQPMEAEELRG